jgi:hypothetical protein
LSPDAPSNYLRHAALGSEVQRSGRLWVARTSPRGWSAVVRRIGGFLPQVLASGTILGRRVVQTREPRSWTNRRNERPIPGIGAADTRPGCCPPPQRNHIAEVSDETLTFW